MGETNWEWTKISSTTDGDVYTQMLIGDLIRDIDEWRMMQRWCEENSIKHEGTDK